MFTVVLYCWCRSDQWQCISSFVFYTIVITLSVHQKTFNIDHILYPKRWVFHIWHVFSFWQDLSDGTINFELVTFDLLLKNLNIGNNFFMLGVSYLACVFLMTDPIDGTINVERVTLTVTFDLLLETLTLTITFLPQEIALSYLACVFLMTGSFWHCHKFLTLTFTVTCGLLFPNINIGNNLCILRDRAFIFGMCVD